MVSNFVYNSISELKERIKELGAYRGYDIPNNEELLQRYSLIRAALDNSVMQQNDWSTNFAIKFILNDMFIHIHHPQNLHEAVPQLIALKTDLIPSLDTERMVRTIIRNYEEAEEKTPEMAKKILAFFRGVLETDLNRACAQAILKFILKDESFEEEMALAIVEKHPSVINMQEHSNGYHTVLAEMMKRVSPESEFYTQKLKFCFRYGADLSRSEMGQQEEVYSCTFSNPIIIKAAKDGNKKFFEALIPYLEPKHTLIKDQFGCTSYYHLMRQRHDVPDEILSALRPPNNALSDRVRSYIDGVYHQKILTNSEHSENLRHFIDAWREIQTDDSDSKSFLFSATLVLLSFYPIISSVEDSEMLTVLWENVSKDIPDVVYSSFTRPSDVPFMICMKIMEINKETAWLTQPLVSKMINDLVEIYPPRVRSLMEAIVEYNPNSVSILDALHSKAGNELLWYANGTPPLPILEHLHAKGATLPAMKIIDLLKNDQIEFFDSIFKYPERYSKEFSGYTYQLAQQRGHYQIAETIRTVMGEQFFTTIFNSFEHLQKIQLGTDDEYFKMLVMRELEYVELKRFINPNKKPFIFDKGFLQRISGYFIEFWMDQTPPYDEFNERLAAFPIKGLYNYLSTQKRVWDEFQNDERLKGFPIEEIWRFGIDAHKEEIGPCAFESEPGYIKSFLEGLLEALLTSNDPKNALWYDHLHATIVTGCLTPQKEPYMDLNSHIRNWNGAQRLFIDYNTSRRFINDVRWSIASLDSDPFGMNDLNKNRFWQLDDDVMVCSYLNGETDTTLEIYQLISRAEELSRDQINLIMKHYNTLIENTESRAQRLMLFLGFARELEIHHYFDDANGRSSHLAFLSMVAGEKSLPFPLFPDPNVFDANGPESLAYRYLEGCLNFRNGGVNHSYMLSHDVKKLNTLYLEGHNDLIELRNELMPLVENKGWDEVMPLLRREESASGS